MRVGNFDALKSKQIEPTFRHLRNPKSQKELEKLVNIYNPVKGI